MRFGGETEEAITFFRLLRIRTLADEFRFHHAIPVRDELSHRHVHVHLELLADSRVDADQFPIQIKQRPTRISTDEHAVGLKCRVRDAHQAPQPDDRSPLFIKSSRMPQREHPVAQPCGFATIHFHKRIAAGFGDFDHRRVFSRHQSERFGLQLGSVLQHDGYFFLHSRRHVRGGQDEAI